MKAFFKKLIVLFLMLSYSHLYSQCDIPQQYTGNTGTNMTVFLTSGAVSALPLTSTDPYIVAITGSGLVVGSASLAPEDLNGGQQSIAVWGDDTQTPEVDGALAGEEINYQLIDGNSLYDLDLTFAGQSSYVSNATTPVLASSAVLNCSESESNSQCDLPEQYSGNTGVNMTLLFTSDVVSSLPISSDSPYLVALSPEGLVVGSTSLAQGDLVDGQQSIAVWGDDTMTPEVDGLSSGQEITLQLVDGNLLYDLTLTVIGGTSFLANSGRLVVMSIAELKTCSDSDISNPGCTDPTAFNFDSEADTDDGSCIPVIIGCTLDWADNYDENANTDDGSCYREGCTLDWADNYDEYATIDDGSCERLGCISNWADNYDPLATISDSSCFIQLNEEEYQSLIESSQGSSDCEEIVIDIQEGWNIFGYTSSQVTEIGEVMAPYDDKIYIIKDNNGSQYWPANNYNGIGDFIPGGGYQIKAYEPFSISF